MLTGIDAHRTLACALAPHPEGDILVIVRVRFGGDTFTPALSVVRGKGLGSTMEGDVDDFMVTLRMALTRPVGGELIVCRVREPAWDAWAWGLLAGAAVPMEAPRAQKFISEELRMRFDRDRGEVLVKCHNAYPLP